MPWGSSVLSVPQGWWKAILLSALFVSGAPPTPCNDSCDANDDGLNNIADAVNILSNLFIEGPNPPPPFPVCGSDPTADVLECESFAACP